MDDQSVGPKQKPSNFDLKTVDNSLVAEPINKPSEMKVPEPTLDTAVGSEDYIAASPSSDKIASPVIISSSRRFSISKIKTFFASQWRTRKLIVIGVSLLALGLIILGTGLLLRSPGKKSVVSAPPAKIEDKVTEPAAPPAPTTVASKLTGLQVAPELNNRPVTAIMIENSPDARPQAGLNEAGIVYEAIAEGGITRFLTLFQEAKPARIGPIRSLRPYYIDWAWPYDPAIAHVGGSQDALKQVKELGLKDLDEFANANTYVRIKERFAPHNVYSDFSKFDTTEAAKGFSSSNFTSFSRKADQPNATPNAKSIDLAISGYLYDPHYDYDASTNGYLRSEGGKAHKVENNIQLAPKVVIALAIPNRPVNSSDGVRMQYDTVGTGSGTVFQDGTATPIKWRKSERKSRLELLDQNGNEFAINSGQTWITVVSNASDIKSKP